MKLLKPAHIAYAALLTGLVLTACKEKDGDKDNKTTSVDAILEGDENARHNGPCGPIDPAVANWSQGGWLSEAPDKALTRVVRQAPEGLIKNFYNNRKPSDFIILEDELSCVDESSDIQHEQYQAACWSYPEKIDQDFQKHIKIHIRNNTKDIHKYLLAAITYAPIDFQIRSYETCVDGLTEKGLDTSECEKIIPNDGFEAFAASILNSGKNLTKLYDKFGIAKDADTKEAAKNKRLQAFLFSESVDSFYCSKATNDRLKSEFPDAWQGIRDTFDWSTTLGEENPKK